MPPNPGTNQITLSSKVYILKSIKRDKVLEVTDEHGNVYILKFINQNGVLTHTKILKNLETREFDHLKIPKLIDSGNLVGRGTWVIMELLKGDDYNGRWNEHELEISGGRTIPLDRIDIFLNLVRDVISIDATEFVGTGVEVLNAETVLSKFEEKLNSATIHSLINQNQANKARELINGFTTSLAGTSKISNGDFQWRNFIDLSNNKTGVVDWDGTRLSDFELEHMLAYQWILMWNNPIWQSEMLKRAREEFEINEHRFQGAMLFTSLHQAEGWHNDYFLGKIEANYFINALDINFIKFILGL